MSDHPGRPVMPRIDLHVTDVQRAELDILIMERLGELRQEMRRKVHPMYQDWLTDRLTQLRHDLINTICSAEGD